MQELVMKNKFRFFIILVVFFFVSVPSFAMLDAKVSKNAYYDTVSTIMKDTESDELKITNDDFWSKNYFRNVKYRPIFMISNKELFKFIPSEHRTFAQTYSAPSIYNISLKRASIINISLSEPKKITKEKPKSTLKTESMVRYEAAKKANVDIDEKLNAVVWLKNTKNYFQAIDLLNDVIKEEPYNAYAYYLKAEIYAQKHETDNAMKNYIQSLKINPSSKQCCLGIAKILEPTNKMLAQKYYEKAK